MRSKKGIKPHRKETTLNHDWENQRWFPKGDNCNI